ncbi:GroES-like protein [Daedaleopsis nitida]|nr:GroES-like protein [Daedaleopsis nitida]
MPQQKALICPGVQKMWYVGESAIPTPGPKDVLVKIMSTGLNPGDWKIQAHGLFGLKFPLITGVDGAGVVEEVGAEVSTFAVGDRILFEGGAFPDQGTSTFQQYSIIPAELVAKIPENISFDQAASIPAALATVFIAIWNHHPQARSVSFPAPWEEGGQTRFAGKPAFIVGGSSSIGQYAIQLARLQKFSPIVATASLHNAELLKSLGATHVIDRSLPTPTILDSLQEITGGAPIEYVFDSVALPDTQALAYQAVAPGGALLIVLRDVIPAELKKEGDNKKIVHMFGMVHTPENRQVSVEVFSRLTEWLRDGTIVPNNVEVLPNGLAGIPDGLERLKQNKVSAKKLIARPQETL